MTSAYGGSTGLTLISAVAALHAPQYAADHADALREDWPRNPLPAGRDALLASATLGKRVAALLDPDTPVDGVTAGKATAATKVIGDVAKLDGSTPSDADWRVTARWGVAGKGGITMPGPGTVVARPFTAVEAAALGPTGVARLGPDTVDVFLNADAFWRNVPRAVWEYRLGGYQVVKKWLSYREAALLGRGLRLDEVRHVRDTARRIAALLLLGPDLDASYAAVAADAVPLPARNPTGFSRPPALSTRRRRSG